MLRAYIHSPCIGFGAQGLQQLSILLQIDHRCRIFSRRARREGGGGLGGRAAIRSGLQAPRRDDAVASVEPKPLLGSDGSCGGVPKRQPSQIPISFLQRWHVVALRPRAAQKSRSGFGHPAASNPGKPARNPLRQSFPGKLLRGVVPSGGPK